MEGLIISVVLYLMVLVLLSKWYGLKICKLYSFFYVFITFSSNVEKNVFLKVGNAQTSCCPVLFYVIDDIFYSPFQ